MSAIHAGERERDRESWSGVVMCRKLPLLIMAIAIFVSTGWSQEYTLINLGTLGGDSSLPYSVNDAGQVAGQAELAQQSNGVNPQHPFLYTNGTMVDLGTLGGDFGEATSVNEHGDVTGEMELSNGGVYHAFRGAGALQDLDPANPGIQSYATGINSAGSVVGERGNVGVIFSGGAITPIPHGSWQFLFPEGINDAGQIGGTCSTNGGAEKACLVTGNTVQNLPPFLAKAVARAINSHGHICGDSFNSTKVRATLWKGGSAFNMGTLPGGGDSSCDGLNDFGQKVGAAYPSGGLFTVAVLFDPVNGIQDLNQLIGSIPSPPALLEARSISNAGFIAVWGVYGGYHYRAFLLKPNSVLIWKKNIFALEQNDPGCIQCRTILDPKARSLPDSLVGLTPTAQKHVADTVNHIMIQLVELERAKEITEPQAQLLLHQSHLVLDADEMKQKR
jgi:probable HAF family extracellular repeat protein